MVERRQDRPLPHRREAEPPHNGMARIRDRRACLPALRAGLGGEAMPNKNPHGVQPQGVKWRGGDPFRKVNISSFALTVKRATSREGWLYRGRA